MDLEEFVDAAADYLEAAGIVYSPSIDEWLETLWKQGVKPHLVVAEYRKKHNAKA
ncbi:hypothetical protein G3A43_08570 [Paraburkholderia aspalathi]|nr:hypothetical protein [Paraburkholderia aspalathi]MBK3780310.1 hypothetical protein [Paraburkholderia aspalathi]